MWLVWLVCWPRGDGAACLCRAQRTLSATLLGTVNGKKSVWIIKGLVQRVCGQSSPYAMVLARMDSHSRLGEGGLSRYSSPSGRCMRACVPCTRMESDSEVFAELPDTEESTEPLPSVRFDPHPPASVFCGHFSLAYFLSLCVCHLSCCFFICRWKTFCGCCQIPCFIVSAWWSRGMSLMHAHHLGLHMHTEGGWQGRYAEWPVDVCGRTIRDRCPLAARSVLNASAWLDWTGVSRL